MTREELEHAIRAACDIDFVRTLLAEKLVTPRKLIARIRLLPVDLVEQDRLTRWIELTMLALRAGGDPKS